MIKSVEIPIYERTLYIVIGDKSRHKLYARFEVPEEALVPCGGSVIAFEDKVVVYLSEERSKATLPHECVHAANIILQVAGVASSAEDDESLAYLVGWLHQAICEKCKIQW